MVVMTYYGSKDLLGSYQRERCWEYQQIVFPAAILFGCRVPARWAVCRCRVPARWAV